MTGVRRSDLIGLRWTDLDRTRSRLSVNRGLVAVGYELHESRGKTKGSRRCIDLDPTTIEGLQAWRALQAAESVAVGIDGQGWMFTTAGQPIHPHALSQAFERIARRSVKVIRLHDLRHTHATLLIAAGVPIKVVSERTRQPGLHHRDLPTRATRHASRSSPHNRNPCHRRSTGHPTSPKSRMNTR
jgi:integrase